MGGLYTLYAETAQARQEWAQKLQEAMGLRAVVQESNKVCAGYLDTQPLILTRSSGIRD